MPKFSVAWSSLEAARIALEEKARTPRMVTSKEQAVSALFESLDRMLSAHHQVSDVLELLAGFGFDMDAPTFERYMRATRARRGAELGTKGGIKGSRPEEHRVNGATAAMVTAATAASTALAQGAAGVASSAAAQAVTQASPPTAGAADILRKASAIPQAV